MHTGLAEFLGDPDHRLDRHVETVEFLRRVEAGKPEFARAIVEPLVLFLGEPAALACSFPLEHGLFQGHQFVIDEFLHEVAQHPVLLAQLETHAHGVLP